MHATGTAEYWTVDKPVYVDSDLWVYIAYVSFGTDCGFDDGVCNFINRILHFSECGVSNAIQFNISSDDADNRSYSIFRRDGLYMHGRSGEFHVQPDYHFSGGHPD